MRTLSHPCTYRVVLVLPQMGQQRQPASLLDTLSWKTNGDHVKPSRFTSNSDGCVASYNECPVSVVTDCPSCHVIIQQIQLQSEDRGITSWIVVNEDGYMSKPTHLPDTFHGPLPNWCHEIGVHNQYSVLAPHQCQICIYDLGAHTVHCHSRPMRWPLMWKTSTYLTFQLFPRGQICNVLRK